ncbi:MAG: chromate resistance protein ChrB domain-containing protein [Dehalococcoidia bacterium]
MRWVTTERLQIDRLASAWLIRRFIDPEAYFTFVPRETKADRVTDGTPFHLEGAALAHHHGRSTFEAILSAYHLADTDPTLAELGEIVRAADALHGPVAFRGKPVREALPADAPPETAGLQLLLHGVRLQSPDDESALTKGATVMDAAYAALQARIDRAGDSQAARRGAG